MCQIISLFISLFFSDCKCFLLVLNVITSPVVVDNQQLLLTTETKYRPKSSDEQANRHYNPLNSVCSAIDRVLRCDAVLRGAN